MHGAPLAPFRMGASFGWCPLPRFRHHPHVAGQPALIEPEVHQRHDGADAAEAPTVKRVVRHPQRADVATLLAVDDGAAVAIGRAVEEADHGRLLGLRPIWCRRRRGRIGEEGHSSFLGSFDYLRLIKARSPTHTLFTTTSGPGL